MTRRGFYPEIQPYRTGYLDVSPEHSIYFEESGNPHGLPAVAGQTRGAEKRWKAAEESFAASLT